MRSSSLLFALAMVLPTQAEGKRYAIVVGVHQYFNDPQKLPRLPHAERDAQRLAKALEEGGHRVVLMTQDEARKPERDAFRPTYDYILRQLDVMASRAQWTPEDVVYLHFSGHGVSFPVALGATETKSYFCPEDARLAEIKTAADVQERHRLISFDEIQRTIAAADEMGKPKCGAGLRLVVWDACRVDPNFPSGTRSPKSLTLPRVPPPPQGVVVLTSCAPNEEAVEDQRLQAGVFTHFLIEGMGGKVVGRDGQVSIAGLYDYAARETFDHVAQHYPGRKQRPGLFGELRVDVPPLVVLDRDRNRPVMQPVEPTFPYSEAEAGEYQRRYAAWAKKPLEITGANGMKFLLVPPGNFLQGNEDTVEELLKLFPYGVKSWFEDAQPRRRRRITQPLYVGKFEVTKGQFAKFVADAGYSTEAEKDGEGGYGWSGEKFEQKPEYSWKNTGFSQGDDHPVANVSWNDATAYIDWLNRQSDGRYRLLTEAEWEYACRAGSGTRFLKGDDQESLRLVGNVADAAVKRRLGDFAKNWNAIASDDGHAFTAPSGSYEANGYGLHDMIGNVWEWCEDKYEKDFYERSTGDDPVNRSSDKSAGRVNRGGGWGDYPARCRAAYRDGNSPGLRISGLGCRVARVP